MRVARFKRVLRAAQLTQRYQPLLECAGLATPEALAEVDSVEGTLERLPAIALEEFRSSPASFESPGGLNPALQTFRSPLEHTPKTAILMPGFEQTSGVRVIAHDWSKGLKRFGASALAAPLTVLRELATSIESGEQEIGGLKHFVIPFTGGEQGELGEDDRERFWRVFQVPLFEQRVGFDGRVIAYECEAHGGLHIMPEHAAFEETADAELLLTSLTDLRHPTLRIGTRTSGSIQRECCDCGNAAPRLFGVRQLAAAAAC
ncbi:MAG: hypothetical protein LAP39_06280 [Acidobacteriia bacterium]|nr:hypothetical protein [Terriglobia bacterium]